MNDSDYSFVIKIKFGLKNNHEKNMEAEQDVSLANLYARCECLIVWNLVFG